MRKSRKKIEEIAQIIKRPLATVKSVVKRYLESTNFESRTRNGLREKLNRYDKLFLL